MLLKDKDLRSVSNTVRYTISLKYVKKFSSKSVQVIKVLFVCMLAGIVMVKLWYC